MIEGHEITVPKPGLRRKDASEYLKTSGISLHGAHAREDSEHVQNGPPMGLRRPLSDLPPRRSGPWAAAKVSPPVKSASERKAQIAAAAPLVA
jgi:hypothetical protein